jgi:hypothetical protein
MGGKGRILGRELYFAFIRVVDLYSLNKDTDAPFLKSFSSGS